MKADGEITSESEISEEEEVAEYAVRFENLVRYFPHYKGGSWREVQMREICQWPSTRSKDDGKLSRYSQLCTVDKHV